MSKRSSISSGLVIDSGLIASLVREQVGKLASSLRPDYLLALEKAAAYEISERGRMVLEQLISNARIAQEKGVPLCQDTGYVWVCLEVSGGVCVPANVFEGVNEAVALASSECGLRMSVLRDALIDRVNTNDNTPAFCEVLLRKSCSEDSADLPMQVFSGSSDMHSRGKSHGMSVIASDEVSFDTSGVAPKGVPSDTSGVAPNEVSFDTSGVAYAGMTLDTSGVSYGEGSSESSGALKSPHATLHIMLKGGGSDNASSLCMLPPSSGIDGVIDFVVTSVAAKGANACPPLVVGVGVGSSFDKVAGLSKHALLREIGSVHPNREIAALEGEILTRINGLEIGPGGLGGSTTALAVHINSAPCHIAALPVAVNMGCTALRSVSISLES